MFDPELSADAPWAWTAKQTTKEIVMDLAYVGLALGFALLTFLLIEGCARLGGKS